MRIQENMKADRVNTVVFNLHQIKRRPLSLGHPLGLQFFKKFKTLLYFLVHALKCV